MENCLNVQEGASINFFAFFLSSFFFTDITVVLLLSVAIFLLFHLFVPYIRYPPSYLIIQFLFMYTTQTLPVHSSYESNKFHVKLQYGIKLKAALNCNMSNVINVLKRSILVRVDIKIFQAPHITNKRRI